MSTALWVIFWVLAVFVGSLMISLVVAAFIRVGGSGYGPDRVRDPGSAGGGEPPGLRAQGDEPETG